MGASFRRRVLLLGVREMLKSCEVCQTRVEYNGFISGLRSTARESRVE